MLDTTGSQVGLITNFLAQMLTEYESSGGNLLEVQLTIERHGQDDGALIQLHGYEAKPKAKRERSRANLRATK